MRLLYYRELFVRLVLSQVVEKRKEESQILFSVHKQERSIEKYKAVKANILLCRREYSPEWQLLSPNLIPPQEGMSRLAILTKFWM